MDSLEESQMFVETGNYLEIEEKISQNIIFR